MPPSPTGCGRRAPASPSSAPERRSRAAPPAVKPRSAPADEAQSLGCGPRGLRRAPNRAEGLMKFARLAPALALAFRDAVSDVSTVQYYPLGTRREEDGQVYRYVKFDNGAGNVAAAVLAKIGDGSVIEPLIQLAKTPACADQARSALRAVLERCVSSISQQGLQLLAELPDAVRMVEIWDGSTDSVDFRHEPLSFAGIREMAERELARRAD